MAQKALLTNHPINRIIDALLGIAARPDLLKKRALLDDLQRAGLDRIFLFSRQLKEQITASSDAEVSIPALTNVQNGLQNVLNELNAFLSNENPGHVTNAISNLDGAISTAQWAFFKRPAKGSKAFGESVAAVEKAAQAAIQSLSDQQTKLEHQLGQTSSTLGDQLSKATEISQKIDATSAEHAAAISRLEAAYQSFEAKAQTQHQETLEAARNAIAETKEEVESEGEESLERLKALEAQAKTIVQIIGNIGVTGNYQNRATNEEKQADLWRWITIGLFVVGIALAAVNLIMNLAGSIDIQTLIIRFAIAVTITVPALYTARESARHRSNADKAKQTELELASLAPFLSNLPVEQRDSVITALAPMYFGRPVENHVVSAPVDVNKLAEAISSTAQKLKPTPA